MTTLSRYTSNGKTTFIYALKDPHTNEIRYIGKSNNPHARLQGHLEGESPLEKQQWIDGLAAKGLIPEMDILEEVPLDQWQERERYWIAFYREQGAQLLNISDGGGGSSGPMTHANLDDLEYFINRAVTNLLEEPSYVRKTFYASPDDERAILIIKRRYGFSESSDVVRFALRVVADAHTQIRLSIPRKKK